jgi:large subunit ribosomal protein L25
MPDITLNAELRTERGSAASGRMRLAGRIPGVVYGKGLESISVSVDHRELRNTFSSSAKRAEEFNLVLDGATHRVRIQELQRDPLKSSARHIDFKIV